MQQPEPRNPKSSFRNYVEKIPVFDIYLQLDALLKSLLDAHLKRYPKSTIISSTVIFNKLIAKLKSVDLKKPQGKELYLIWLTSVAEELQSLRCYHAEELVLLGKLLTQKINDYIKDNRYTRYLNCEIERENSFFYQVRNAWNKFAAAGPAPVVSSPLLDGIVAPFAQEETTFLSFPVGYKNRLAEINRDFSDLCLSAHSNRTLTRFQKQRIGEGHQDQYINVFKGEYKKESSSHSEFENVIYIIGVHGNAFNAPSMLRFLDREAVKFLRSEQGKTVDKIVVLAPDYPGSAASGGRFATIQELAIDSMVLLVRDLLDKGVDPSQIICLGHSLGGAILVEGDHQLLQKNIVTTIVSINSFSQIQKHANDSTVVGKVFLGQYNIKASSYFQDHPKHRRFVEHTQDDPVIPLRTCSLLIDLEANKDGITEGTLLEAGGHDLFAHDITSIIGTVAEQQARFQQIEDQKCLRNLLTDLERIIASEQVTVSSLTLISEPESPRDVTPSNQLTRIQDDYQYLLTSLALTQPLPGNAEIGNVTKSRWNIKVLLGFAYKTYLKLETEITAAEASRKLFQSHNSVVEACIRVKTGLGSFFDQKFLSSFPLTAEMLCDYQHFHEQQAPAAKTSP